MNTTLNSVTMYANDFFGQIAAFLPRVVAALLILLIGYIVARVIAGIIKKALEAVKLDSRLHSARGGSTIRQAIPNPSHLISRIAYWLIFLFVISLSLTALGVPAINDFLRGVYGYVPNVVAALLIFIVAGAISAGISAVVTATMGNTSTGKIVASVAPIVVMGLATFAILNQLQIAPEIVTITYAGLVGTAVLAFGLGGREAASRMLNGLYENAQQHTESAASDFKQGAETAKQKAQDLGRRIK